MFRRNLIVVYKPIKNNFVLLSDANHRILNLNDNENCCLNLIYNQNVDHYISWAPYGGQSVRDTEIGINALVAQEIGLFEGSIVTCKLVDDIQILASVQLTASNQKDWEMLDVSSYRIQNTMLDQTRIINKHQRLVVWINRAMHITLTIDELCPKANFGRIVNDTEFIIAPYHGLSHSRTTILNGKLNGIKTISTDQLLKKHVNGIPKEIASKNNLNDTKLPFINGANTANHMLRNSFSTSSISSIGDFSTSANENGTSKRNSAYIPELRPNAPVVVKTNDYTNSKNNCSYIEKFNHSKKNKLEEQKRLMNDLVNDLRKAYKKEYAFRLIPTKWIDTQICDVFITRHNIPDTLDVDQIYNIHVKPTPTTDPLAPAQIDERSAKDFYVNIKIVSDDETFPHNIYPTIEINDLLMAQLNIKPLDRVILSPVEANINRMERIELYPSQPIDGYRNCRTIEDAFKQLIIDKTILFPILINQQQCFRLADGAFIVTVKFFPETLKYSLCDATVLRDCKISCMEEIKPIDTVMKLAEKISQYPNEEEVDARAFVIIDKFQDIVDKCTQQIIFDLCLNEQNRLRKISNCIIVGSQNTGKTQIVKQVLKNLAAPPYYCYWRAFHCARSKGRKPESIQRDLRSTLIKCLEHSPAILVLHNLDILAQKVVEQSQDSDYYNRVSDVITQLITEFTENHAIAVIVTVFNKNNLNDRIYTPRGEHIFQTIYTIPNLETTDREKTIRELCKQINIRIANIDYTQFSQFTEGYAIADLVQLVDRAMFYAHRNNTKVPILTHEILMNSLKATNEYCLNGIESNNLANDSDGDAVIMTNGQVPGLESAITVLEEVLVWPAKFTGIFENSPLRNQAGILLFGAPGTGKTLLVRQIARTWNLRMISVKGPELLAKFIGQSEENVRKIFDKARKAKPCVLFFDEFDSLAPRRGHDSTGVTDRVVNQLLTELDGVEGLQGVVVIAATSRPELLDPALLRSGRIDRMVECQLPDRKARLKIFEALATAANLHLDSKVQLQYFCNQETDFYTGADIHSILTSANMIAVKECLEQQDNNVPDQIVINQTHLLEAFKNTRPSLSKQDVKRYNQLYAKFLNKEKTQDFVAQRATLA